jgi:hypothetical protein
VWPAAASRVQRITECGDARVHMQRLGCTVLLCRQLSCRGIRWLTSHTLCFCGKSCIII